eukprot:767424-Rhodomonas_salina.1
MVLRARYGMSGTELGCAGTDAAREPAVTHRRHRTLSPYASAMRCLVQIARVLCAWYAVSGTDLQTDYALATLCPVLIYGAVLPARGLGDRGAVAREGQNVPAYSHTVMLRSASAMSGTEQPYEALSVYASTTPCT